MNKNNMDRGKFLKTLFMGGVGVGIGTGLIAGCTDLSQNPLSSLSQSTFWESKSDAKLALVGIYHESHVGTNAYTNNYLCYESATDDLCYRNGGIGVVYNGYFQPTGPLANEVWGRSYTTIYRVNYFLENIDKVKMDADAKDEMIAEARFLRAYEYFLMSIFYGGVPLVTKTLTKKEANTKIRDSLQEIQKYCIDELGDCAKDLPVSRPSNEKGRILRAAAQAVKGRLLMITKNWGQAAATYKNIIDASYHIIDPRYKALFTVNGEDSKEIILSANMIAGKYGNPQNQLNYTPEYYGGYQEDNPFQELVDAHLMNDGLSIEESPLYDSDHPYENRDPRLHASIFLPGYTSFNGKLWSKDLHVTRLDTYSGVTGYGIKKYARKNYKGDRSSSGDDIIFVRYAEVLLSYLESKLENGDTITQNLLDQTINKVRGRDAVDMPPVTEVDPDKLRPVIRRERRVEFALERIIRYMDIRRWGIFNKVMNTKCHGMKITDNPKNYNGSLELETSGKYKGHVIVIDRRGTHPASDALVPIPQSEIDINPNLKQNPGY